MVKLYLILCVATFLLVSLPALCGFDDAPAAAGGRAPAEKPADGVVNGGRCTL